MQVLVSTLAARSRSSSLELMIPEGTQPLWSSMICCKIGLMSLA